MNESPGVVPAVNRALRGGVEEDKLRAVAMAAQALRLAAAGHPARGGAADLFA